MEIDKTDGIAASVPSAPTPISRVIAGRPQAHTRCWTAAVLMVESLLFFLYCGLKLLAELFVEPAERG
jgi:hypothetical protein